MGQGCPVVCSNPGGSVPEIAGDAVAYFNGHDVADMQRVLEATLNDATCLKELRERGFERHRQFSWEKTASETVNVYGAVSR
jgi:glycosyltransferase involved in cell wall biosynthesis